MTKVSKRAVLILTDIACINIAYIIAFLFRFEYNVYSELFIQFFDVYIDNAIAITMIKIAIFAVFGLYNSLWKYAGTEEVIKVILAATGAMAAVFLYLSVTQEVIPRGIQGICFFMDIIFIGGSRLSYRTIRNFSRSGYLFPVLRRVNSTGMTSSRITRVLIIGAGDAGASMIKEIGRNPGAGKKVVAVIDDDPEKIGKRIVGKKIVGNRREIGKAVNKYRVDEIIIAIPSAKKKEIQGIVNECNKTGCKIKILPAYIDLIDGKVNISKLRKLQIDDLLGRDPIMLKIKEISSYIQNKTILVTGGGGSIGSEICRQIAVLKPEKLIVLDIYENSIFELSNEIKSLHPELRFETVIASVRNKERLREVFDTYKPHVIFHAAAHKHVPLMENNPKEAALNNILGTKNVIDMADMYSAEKFVLISTDKAVNPTSVMGATKRVAEMLMQEKNNNSKTCYSAVRFGNVLGSNGSVLPIFRRQIEMGGPVTVTHEEITRYFMTIPEAVQLVMQAGAMANGGEIFILDMGEAVKIMDLVENVILLSGYIPHEDIEIVVTGLRPGEKLYEELYLNEEGIMKTTHDSIFVAKPVQPAPELMRILEQGEDSLHKKVIEVCRRSDPEVKKWLHTIVPNYVNNNETELYPEDKETVSQAAN